MNEVQLFFSWIASTMVFIAFCYLFRFNSVYKQQQTKAKTDSIWQSKKAKDFLHYLKFELDLFNILAFTIFYHASTFLYFHTSLTGEWDWIFGGFVLLLRFLMLAAFIRVVTVLEDNICGIKWYVAWSLFFGFVAVSYTIVGVEFVKHYDRD